MTATELRLDYFLFYDLQNKPAAGNIVLQGQFDRTRMRMQLALLDFFANPVSKNGEPLFDKHAHLAWYRGVQPPEPLRQVVLENQFGRFEIRTGTGYGILVPTQKIEPGSEFPQRLDHYKVYRLADVEQAPAKTVKLKDQFGTSEARVRLPLFFAVPVRKRHGDQDFPIQNKDAHLLIFSITTREVEKAIRLKNQFAPNRIAAKTVRSLMLGVPSLKREWKQV